MKIVNKEEFLKLPPYTLYCEYEYDYYDQLKVKGDTYGCSYGEIYLNDNPNELSFNRNGMFEEDKLYAVYDKKDVEKVIELLNKCL